MNGGDNMAQTEINVQVDINKLYEALCPECKLKLAQILGEDVIKKMKKKY